MKKLLLLFAILLASCGPKAPESTLPRIAIAGLGIESSTFSPATTDEAAFYAADRKITSGWNRHP
jgi:hypothetical protein